MCVFCSILEGNIPSTKILENEDAVAILDISQITKGHTLVLPKKHYDTILDVPSEELSAMMDLAQEVAKLQMKNLHAKGFNILNNGYEIAGQTVMHAHLHVIPRYDENDGITINFTPSENPDLEKIAEELTK